MDSVLKENTIKRKKQYKRLLLAVSLNQFTIKI